MELFGLNISTRGSLRKTVDDAVGKAVMALPGDVYRYPWTTLSGGDSGVPTGNQPGSWQRPKAAELEQAFRRHPIVRGCVERVMEAASDARIEIGTEQNGRWEAAARHDMLDLIATPNAEYTERDIVVYWVSRLLLTGRSFIWKIRAGNGRRIAELWPIPTSWVTEKRGSGTQLVSGYELHGQEGVFPREDLIVCRDPDPATTNGAASRLEAAYEDFRLDVARENFQEDMLANLRIPGMHIHTRNQLSTEQKNDISRDLANRLGPGRRGGPIFTHGEDGSVELFNPLSDLDWPGFTALNETRICSAFGVDPILLGLRSGRSTYSNYENARKMFYNNTMAPIWNQLADALTQGLLRQEGETRLTFRFRYDELPEFQEDETEKSGRVIEQYQAGVITIDEARQELGREALTPEQVRAALEAMGRGGGSDGDSDSDSEAEQADAADAADAAEDDDE